MREAEAPHEMVNLGPRVTGLPMTTWASPRGSARRDVRIKVNPTHGRQMVIGDAASVAVRPVARSSLVRFARRSPSRASDGSR